MNEVDKTNSRLKKHLSDSNYWANVIVKNLKNPVWVTDNTGQISYINPKMAKMVGYDISEIIGKFGFDFLSKASITKMKSVFGNKINKDHPNNFEIDFVHKNGKKIPTLAQVSVLSNGGTVGVITELENLRKKDAALKKSEERFRNLANALPQVVFETDTKGQLLFVNERAFGIFGYSKKDFEDGLNIFKMIEKSDREKALNNFQDILKIAKPSFNEYNAVKGDGSIFPVAIHSAPVMKDGVVVGLEGILIDMTKPKLAEKELLDSREKYQSIVDQSMVGICMLKGTKIMFANKKLSDIFGYLHPQLLEGLDISSVLKLSSFKRAKKITLERQNGKKLPEIGEYTGIKRNGKQFFIQTYSKRIEVNGQSYAQIFVTDVTDKRIVETKLAERIKETKVLYRVYSHTKMSLPLAKVLSYVSRDIIHAFQFMEYAQSRIVLDSKEYKSSKRFSSFISKIEEPIIINGKIRGKLQVGYVKKINEMEGDPFWTEERKLIENISKILAKHIFSREVLERHKKIVTKSVTAIFIATDGIIRFANPKFFKMFKCNSSDVLNKLFLDFVIPCSCPQFIMSNPNLNNFKCSPKGKRKDGTFIDLDLSIQRIDYHGKSGILGMLHDVTFIKQAENQLKNFNEELKLQVADKTKHLKEANKRLQSLNNLKDEFIAVTSHELRSPLTSIRGYLSFLVEKESLDLLPPSMQKYLLRAYNNAESLNYLVNNILDVSRLDLGRFDLQFTKVDLIVLLKKVIESFLFQASEKKLKLKFINLTKSSKLNIVVDSIRITQVIRNLADNAIKFSKRGKDIYFKVSKNDDFAIIEIVDQGVGIPKAKVDKIFNKFIQVKNSDTRYKGGAGLGLFISKRIIELHGGQILAKSPKNKGAIFIIQLPLHTSTTSNSKI